MDYQQHVDQAVERVVERSPEIVMECVIEETKHSNSGTGPEFYHQKRIGSISGRGWRRVRLDRKWNAFQRASGGDLPAKGEPLRVVLEPNIKPTKAWPFTYASVKSMKAETLAACMPTLIVMELVVLRMQGVWATQSS